MNSNISSDGYWFPGKSITKSISITNTENETKNMTIVPIDYSSNKFAESLNLNIFDKNNFLIWSGSLDSFYKQPNINLGVFKPKTNNTYKFIIKMKEESGNEYQKLRTGFNLEIGFSDTITSTPGVLGINKKNNYPGLILISITFFFIILLLLLYFLIKKRRKRIKN